VFKRLTDDYADTNVLRPRNAYNIPLTRRDPGPDGVLGNADDGRSVTIFDYDPRFRGAAFVANQRQNTPRSDRFHSMEFTVTKRASGRWMAVGSFWAVKNHQWLTLIPDNPNNDPFPVDDTWIWASTVSGSYQLPWNVQLSAFLQSKSGIKGQRTYVFRAVDPDGGPRLQQLGTVTMRLDPFGSQKGPAISIVNLRAGKRFSLWGAQRFDVDFDVYNLLNSSAPTSTTFVSEPTFGYATRVVPARVARIGARYSF